MRKLFASKKAQRNRIVKTVTIGVCSHSIKIIELFIVNFEKTKRGINIHVLFVEQP
jgi:hypothetical protein